MTTKGPLSRFAFYWNEQRGKCALMITDTCRAHGGMMLEPKKGASVRYNAQPTWDHIYPKPRTTEQEPVQMLACAPCNHKRGNAPARPEYVALALALLEEWVKLNLPQPKGQPNAKRERRRMAIAKTAVAYPKPSATTKQRARVLGQAAPKHEPQPEPVKVNYEKHPFLPATGYDEPMTVRIRREQRNAESQAAALKHIAERMKAQGRTEDAQLITAKAANILAAVRGKPPERK